MGYFGIMDHGPLGWLNFLFNCKDLGTILYSLRYRDHLTPWCRRMSEQELREFIEKMAALRVANTATPEQASQFLQDEGYLTEDGQVAEPYVRAAARR